jgi:hypothetical protein
MSETLFKFLLSEVKLVRVTCRHKMDDGSECGGVVEVPIEKLAKVIKCPVCDNHYAHNYSPFAVLGKNLQDAVALEVSAAKLEFVIPKSKID